MYSTPLDLQGMHMDDLTTMRYQTLPSETHDSLLAMVGSVRVCLTLGRFALLIVYGSPWVCRNTS